MSRENYNYIHKKRIALNNLFKKGKRYGYIFINIILNMKMEKLYCLHILLSGYFYMKVIADVEASSRGNFIPGHMKTVSIKLLFF